jgi:hypothetical protein
MLPLESTGSVAVALTRNLNVTLPSGVLTNGRGRVTGSPPLAGFRAAVTQAGRVTGLIGSHPPAAAGPRVRERARPGEPGGPGTVAPTRNTGRYEQSARPGAAIQVEGAGLHDSEESRRCI